MVVLMWMLVACPSDNKVARVYPNLTVVPESLDFGEVVEDYSETLALDLVNGGLARLEITAIRLEGDGSDAYEIVSLPTEILQDETGEVILTFTPPQQTTYEATLIIVSNDEESPEYAVPITGAGVDAPAPDIALSETNLDFGTIGVGANWNLFVDVANEGDGVLNIGEITRDGSSAFVLMSDLEGVAIQPGDTYTMAVSYVPTHDLGDHGLVTIASDDPDEPEVELILIGNGGGDFEYPVALIVGPSDIAPRETVVLDGSGSYDPGGLALTYAWTLTTVPDYSSAGESFLEETETAYFTTDLAGEYAVELEVTNSMGISGVPAEWSAEAIPDELLHIELTWNTPNADLDLHLAQDGDELYADPGDVNYCNPNPEWGDGGLEDDPRLDIDDYYGYGPENINIDEPQDDTYTARVHYYVENGDGDTSATVKVYTYGELVGTYSKILERNDVWDVAEVTMPSGASVELSNALYDPELRTCE